MARLAVIVPVSPFEPLEILINSAKHLLSLDYGDLDFRILFVVDRSSPNDRRGEELRKLGVDVLERSSTRGKRAGAINDGLKHLAEFNPDYVAIFDVDSRPERDFIVKCVSALESDKNAYIASTRRFISNPINLVSETVEAEYYFINFLLKKSKFKQFNGLIGVLRAEYLMRFRLNEDAITEDADFATRMHCKGYRAILVEGSKVYEQAPVRWKDLFSQRKRWYYGGLQLWRYWKDVKKSKDFGFKLSWLSALTFTYVIALFMPLLVLAPPLLLYKFRNVKKILVTLGLAIHVLILQYSAICAILEFIRGRCIEWSPIERVPQ
jgi:cellulose synthase/poly-beta-1,6-N-acetylglucosamine synthase-like glycosyltransferase